jgi:flagellar hook-length control protein FliK
MRGCIAIEEHTSTGKASGSRLQSGLTRRLGNATPAKTAPQNLKRKKTKKNLAPAYAFSTLSMAMQNLINMVAVTAVSGAVLLALLAAKHF